MKIRIDLPLEWSRSRPAPQGAGISLGLQPQVSGALYPIEAPKGRRQPHGPTELSAAPFGAGFEAPPWRWVDRRQDTGYTLMRNGNGELPTVFEALDSSLRQQDDGSIALPTASIIRMTAREDKMAPREREMGSREDKKAAGIQR